MPTKTYKKYSALSRLLKLYFARKVRFIELHPAEVLRFEIKLLKPELPPASPKKGNSVKLGT